MRLPRSLEIKMLCAAVSPDFIEVSHLEGDSDHEAGGVESDEMGVGGDSPELSPLAGLRRQLPSSDAGHDGDISQLTINVSTLSAPEVSLMPSPEVSKVGCECILCTSRSLCELYLSYLNIEGPYLY